MPDMGIQGLGVLAPSGITQGINNKRSDIASTHCFCRDDSLMGIISRQRQVNSLPALPGVQHPVQRLGQESGSRGIAEPLSTARQHPPTPKEVE